jgi:hypothetical protein
MLTIGCVLEIPLVAGDEMPSGLSGHFPHWEQPQAFVSRSAALADVGSN